MKNYKILILSILCFGMFGTVHASDSITKSLYKGISDPEVINLQKFLNNYPDTTVSESGSGSKGFETAYFGEKTKSAVIRFQNKYASEILTPNSLTAGNGFVGVSTRKKIISLLNTVPLALSTLLTHPDTPSVLNSNSIIPITAPVILDLSPQKFNDGDTLTIRGKGFTQKNTIILSVEQLNKYINIPSTNDGTVITIKVDTALGDAMRKGMRDSLSKMPEKSRSTVIEKILKGFRKDNDQTETGDRTMLAPTNVRVENEHGKSNNTKLNINVFKEIQ